MDFTIHSPETAPEAARPALEKIRENYGFVPNLAGVLAEAPAALEGFGAMLSAFEGQNATLAPLERQVVLLAVSATNACGYCTAAHGMLSHKLGLDRDQVTRLQTGMALADPRLEALRRFTVEVVTQRGAVDPGRAEAFLAAGFERAQVLEVVVGVALKTLTNYANHLAQPPLNEAFADYALDTSRAA